MDLDKPRSRINNPSTFPLPHTPPSHQIFSRRTSVNSDKVFELDHNAIPRKPGSARLRILPNITSDKNVVGQEKSVNLEGGEQENIKMFTEEIGKSKKTDRRERSRQTNAETRKGSDRGREKDEERHKGRASNQPPNYALKDRGTVKQESSAGQMQEQSLDRTQPKMNDLPLKNNHSTAKSRSPNRNPVDATKKLTTPPETVKPKKISEEKHIMLAVKLPSGERYQRNFRLSDHLRVILQFAQASSKRNLRGCELVCLDPKMILQNLQKTIGQANLPDKTLLYVQLPEQ